MADIGNVAAIHQQQSFDRREQEITVAERRLEQAQAIQRAIRRVAGQIEDRRHHLGPGKHRAAFDLALARHLAQGFADVR